MRRWLCDSGKTVKAGQGGKGVLGGFGRRWGDVWLSRRSLLLPLLPRVLAVAVALEGDPV
jgi:hypothetical protein